MQASRSKIFTLQPPYNPKSGLLANSRHQRSSWHSQVSSSGVLTTL
jgi:hypothetical protein